MLVFADIGILLQNDTLRPGELGVPNKVQLYGEASTATQTGLLRYANDPDAAQSRYYVKCDTPLRITFFVANESTIVARYTGSFVAKRGGRPFEGTVETRITGFGAADGWSARCANCAVRRVNTLAVGGGDPVRPGSYFGIDETHGERTPTGRWSDAVAGRYREGAPGDAASYDLQPFAARPRDIVDSPAGAKLYPAGRPAFIVAGEGRPSERIAIDER